MTLLHTVQLQCDSCKCVLRLGGNPYNASVIMPLAAHEAGWVCHWPMDNHPLHYCPVCKRALQQAILREVTGHGD